MIIKEFSNRIAGLFILMTFGISGTALGQSSGGQTTKPGQAGQAEQVPNAAQQAGQVSLSGHVSPWAPTELGLLPPIAPLTGGVWLKGDLHVHSRHSKES